MDIKRLRRYLPAAIAGVLVLLIIIVVYLTKDLFERPAQTKKQIQQITMIQPPPPPPPPPPQEKPPEPEVKEEKIEEPEPEPEPEPQQDAEPPPGEDLGVDAEGGAGGDSFGLVGKKGGRGLFGGGGGNAIIWYGQQLQRTISGELQRTLKDQARNSKYQAVLYIWISPQGSISRVELGKSSGIAEIDDALRDALGTIRGQFDPPPEHMPQPVKIRVQSEG